MTPLNASIMEYQIYCRVQKRLSENTMRAYAIDIEQFLSFIATRNPKIQNVEEVSKVVIKLYIEDLFKRYATRTCKRKIACIKAYLNYLEFEDVIPVNPFRKVRIPIRESKILPKVMQKEEVQHQFNYVYDKVNEAKTPYSIFCAKRDVACYELLFSTGMRVGELCHLSMDSIDLSSGKIRILGKGNKERIVYITSSEAVSSIKTYMYLRKIRKTPSKYFFINWVGRRLTESSVRRTVKRVAQITISKRITPHMFRHTFATMLLENMVDIRYIQEVLGHSSITTTQIYLHLCNTAVRSALEKGNPRNNLTIQTA